MQTPYVLQTTYAILDARKHGPAINDARLKQRTAGIHVGLRVLDRKKMALVCAELVEGGTSLEEGDARRID